jgi:cbb3-type cytochrome oxidase subunit 3
MLERSQRTRVRPPITSIPCAAGNRVNAGNLMEHPVQYLTVVTKFLDRMIEEHGDRLFVVFGFFCLGVIAWILTRKRKHPVQDFSVVILPLGLAPRQEPERLPEPFEDRSSL